MEMRDLSQMQGVAQPLHADKKPLTFNNPAHEERFLLPERILSQIGLSQGQKIADFGAGAGKYVLAAAKEVGVGGRVYAIDVQKDLLKKIHNEAEKEGLKNVDVIWGDVEKPNGSKLASGAADIVLVINSLFQCDDKKGVLFEASRILKEGGFLAIVDWKDSFGGMGPHKQAVLKEEEALSLVPPCGFEIIRKLEAGGQHYGLLAKKKIAQNI